jgi:hypothetical protein
LTTSGNLDTPGAARATTGTGSFEVLMSVVIDAAEDGVKNVRDVQFDLGWRVSALGGASAQTKWVARSGSQSDPTGGTDLTPVVTDGGNTASWYEGQLVTAQMATMPFTLFLVGQVDTGSLSSNVYLGTQIELVYDVAD